MEKNEFVFVGKFNDLGVESTQEFGKGTLLMMGDVSAMIPTKFVKVSKKGEKYFTMSKGFKVEIRVHNEHAYDSFTYVVDGKYNSFKKCIEQIKVDRELDTERQILPF